MAEQQTAEIKIPEDLTAEQRDELASEIIEIIRRRSESGVGVRKQGRGFTTYKFPAYSESYVNSAEFKAAGKSRGRIDLTLSGDMLASIQLISHSRGSLVVGFDESSPENARAEGNQLGSYGGSPNPRKARRFLGATKEELDEALQKIGYL